MTPLELVTLSAATWAVSYMVTHTAGPFSVFALIRLHTPLGGLTTCIVCLSVWVAFALCMLRGHNDLIDAFAVAGMALLLHSYSGWIHFGNK